MELTQQGQITDVTQHSFAPDKIQHKYNISSRIRSSREVHGRSHHLRGDQLGWKPRDVYSFECALREL
jgi:hypothetical protein